MTTYIVFRENCKPVSSPDFQRQLEKLLEKEKSARINSQHFSSVSILKDIVSLCYQTQQWGRLNEMIVFLMGRRGQSKKAQVEMIQLIMSWLSATREPQRTALIQTIRDVCAKKIFLEVEYARCVLMIVRGKEQEEDVAGAASILQEVQVETYGSMDKREKVEFILYQMKLMLRKKDYVRFYIISKKINENNINEKDIVDLKVTYFAYMAIYYNQHLNLSQCCRCYRILWQTLTSTTKPIPQELDFHFSARTNDLLSNYIALLVLQPYSPANHTELKKLSQSHHIEQHPHFHHLITKFLLDQVISCKLTDYQTDSFEVFRPSYPQSSVHLQELQRMLVQHDIRIIAKYYDSLTVKRVSELLRVEQEYCEEEICTLNNQKVISCRIDRIDGVIDFKPIQNEEYLLKNWNQSINGILDLVDITTNLIHREREVHRKQ